MTTPEDQKAEKCPFCDQSPVELSDDMIGCKTFSCPVVGIKFTQDQWNTRPRESELDRQVAMLKEQVRIGDEASTFHMQMSHKLRQRESRLEEVLREAYEQMKKVRRFLPTHGTFGEEGISDYESALSAINAALEEKR